MSFYKANQRRRGRPSSFPIQILDALHIYLGNKSSHYITYQSSRHGSHMNSGSFLPLKAYHNGFGALGLPAKNLLRLQRNEIWHVESLGANGETIGLETIK